MLSPIITVLLLALVAIPLAVSRDDQRTIQVVSELLKIGSKCSSIIVVYEDDDSSVLEKFREDEGLMDEFIEINQQSNPVTLLEISALSLLKNSWNTEPVCQNVVIFSRQISKLTSVYRQMKSNFHVDKVTVVARFSPEETHRLLFEIQNENLFVLLEKNGRDLELYSWSVNNKTSVTTIRSHSNVKTESVINRSVNLSGRHLTIATLAYPPSVVIDPGSGKIRGIEPSVMESLAYHLQFTFDFVQASPNEMWGEIFGSEGNISFTGLLGMLVRKEVDVATGELYISSIRAPFISYTVVYSIGYETFLVPAPRPYSKWTALFYPFTWPTWMATIASAFVVIVMLRLVATYSSQSSLSLRNNMFTDFQFCCLYVIGNLSNMQVQPQNIISNANRMFLIWWLFGTLILTTGYRSGLISYMTFPFTPPTIDTLQQLVDSSLKKVVFGGFIKSILLNSTNELEKKIGQDLIPNYNLTGMFVSLESGSSAVQSNLNNLLYMAATMYPTTTAGPRVHLIKENIMPAWVAFGLQKNSQLKPYFDKGIQRLIESGLIDYHKTKFAKKLDKWNPKKANDRISFSLDSLQGAFYLLGIGVVASIVVFVIETSLMPIRVFNRKQRKSKELKKLLGEANQ